MAAEYILVLRNNTLYKAPIGALSSVVVFSDAYNKLSSSIENFMESISDTSTNFQYDYYSKAQMESDFCLKQSVSDLTANATYMSKTDVTNQTANLKTVNDVDTWYVKEVKYCAKYMTHEYDEIRAIMTKSTEFDAADYIRTPNDNSVVNDNGEVTDPSKWY